MDLMRARVTLRERPLLDVFDLALRFCTVHARAYAKMSLAVLVPAFALSWAVAHEGGWWLGSDNPDAGAVDSRHFGPVMPEQIEGRVLGRYWRARTRS